MQLWGVTAGGAGGFGVPATQRCLPDAATHSQV